MLSGEQLSKYRTLYYQRFGKEISAEDAHERAIRLLSLMAAICPMPDKIGVVDPESAPVTERSGSMIEFINPRDGHRKSNAPTSMTTRFTEKIG